MLKESIDTPVMQRTLFTKLTSTNIIKIFFEMDIHVSNIKSVSIRYSQNENLNGSENKQKEMLFFKFEHT